MADDEVPTRDEAIRLAREDRQRTQALLDGIAADALTITGFGGGTWSAKDLIGHLESWEEYALDALDAWERGEGSPIAEQLRTIGTDEINRRGVERKAERPLDEVRSSAAATHERLIDRFAAISEARWAEPPTAQDADATVGGRLGGILGGRLGGFRHDPDHWSDLEAFAADHPA